MYLPVGFRRFPQHRAMALAAAALFALAGCGEKATSGPGEAPGDSATGGPEAGGVPVPADARSATVRSVTDGDTVTLSDTGDTRLIGVDTPELGEECFGDEAAAFTERVLEPGTEVSYVLGDEEEDRYGRALAYLWLPDERFVNGVLVARGYATPLTIAPNNDHAGVLRDLARDAREDDEGLWAREACGGPGGGPGVGGSNAGATMLEDGSGGGQAGDAGAGGGGGEATGDFCEPSYPDVCVPPAPPDLACDDVNESGFAVRGADPHGFDADGDGVGCDG